MYGYLASHNWGTTLLLSNGLVYEQCTGGQWYVSERDVDIEEYALKEQRLWGVDWRKIDEEEIRTYIGELQ